MVYHLIIRRTRLSRPLMTRLFHHSRINGQRMNTPSHHRHAVLSAQFAPTSRLSIRADAARHYATEYHADIFHCSRVAA